MSKDASPPKAVTLADIPEITVRVSDTGSGIAAEVLPVVFDRFVKTHVDVDFRQLADDYQSGQHLGHMEGAWDYVEFREILTLLEGDVPGAVAAFSRSTGHWAGLCGP